MHLDAHSYIFPDKMELENKFRRLLPKRKKKVKEERIKESLRFTRER